jgi:hypothetical protein
MSLPPDSRLLYEPVELPVLPLQLAVQPSPADVAKPSTIEKRPKFPLCHLPQLHWVHLSILGILLGILLQTSAGNTAGLLSKPGSIPI